MLASAKIAQPGLPVIAAVTEFRDTFGIALTNMINGADPAAELKKATADFQPCSTRAKADAGSPDIRLMCSPPRREHSRGGFTGIRVAASAPSLAASRG